MHTVAECVGPVSALDKALRLALEKAYPAIKDTALSGLQKCASSTAGGEAIPARGC